MNWKKLYPKETNLVKLSLKHGGSIKPLIIPSKLTGGTGLLKVLYYLHALKII
jgi:hypothetical protein